MEYFLLVACVGAGVVAAAAWARSVVRRKPTSATGVVLSCVDDRALAGGIVAGLAIAICQELAQNSWFGWSWGTPIMDAARQEAASSTTVALLVGIPLLVLIVFSPLVVAVIFPAPALALSVFFSYRRGEDTRSRHPAVTALVAAAVTFVLGGPAAGSACLGVTVAVIGVLVRRKPPVPDVVSALPARLDLPGSESRSGTTTQSWELLSPANRYHAARVSAVNIVSLMTVIVATSALGLLVVS